MHAGRLGVADGDLVLIVHSGSRGLGERILRTHTDVHGAGPAEPIVDRCHNLGEIRDGRYLHRKGAAPGDGRDVLVAGTRGTASYLVAAHAGPDANYSVAHGAGRRMSRADALRRGRVKHTVAELRRTPVNSVVCGDRQLLFEEAPTAYNASSGSSPTWWPTAWPPAGFGPSAATGRTPTGRRRSASTAAEPRSSPPLGLAPCAGRHRARTGPDIAGRTPVRAERPRRT